MGLILTRLWLSTRCGWDSRAPGPQVNIARQKLFARLRRVLHPFIHWIEARGEFAPWLFLALFLVASLLMIWRLEAMSAGGFEGTVLGTLVMPYCSGMGNLIFAFILGRNGGSGADVMTNSLVNNVTNMTLVLGLPAILWGMNVIPQKKPAAGKKKKPAAGNPSEVHRFSLLLTLLAVLFFTGAVWALGRKGRLDFNDGLVLVGLFLFWQCFHVFEVLKQNVRQGRSALGWMLPVNLALLAVGAYGIYVSTDWLVKWVSHFQTGFISAKHLGWLSGWLDVLPNALLAFYYGWRKQPEVVYASQVGDAHVSIPLCLGIYALYHTMVMPAFFHMGMLILLGSTLVHFFFVAVFGRLPRLVGVALVAAYGWFLWKGLLG
jgi:cation:H+ antiporter